MERLRCGVIFTGAFIDYLRGRCATEAEAGTVPEIHYLHCVEGENRGKSWWNLTWSSRSRFAESELFHLRGLEVALSRQTQKALRWKYIDCKDGQVTVA